MKKLLPKCKEWRMDSLFSLKVFMLLAMIVGGTNGVWAQTVISTFTMPSENPTPAEDGQNVGDDKYYLGQDGGVTYFVQGLKDKDNRAFVKNGNAYKLQGDNIDKVHFKFQFAPGTVQAGDIITVSCNQVYNNNATVGYKVGGSNSEATASWTSGGALVDVSHIIQTNEIITDGENQYIRIGRLANPNQHTGFAKFTITRPAGYQVYFGPNIEGRGTVTATVNGEEITSGTRVVSGTQVTFTATPSSSEYLTWGWNVNGADDWSFNNPYTITQDVTIKQKFTRGWYINATSKNSELGSVTVSGNGQTNTNIHITPYPYTNVTFTASPNAGAELEGWYTDEACTNKVQAEEGKITINGNEVVYDDQKFPDPSNSDNNVLNLWAKFKSIIPTYTVNYDTGLSIPENCEWWYTVGDDETKIKETRTFTAGTKITYHASDYFSENSLFNCWNDNDSYVQYNNKNWTKTESLSENLNVKPDFVDAIKYVGNVQNNIGGSVKVYKKDDQGYVTSEEVNGKKIKHWETKGAQFVPEAADGYKFVGWVEGGNDNPYDLSNPTAGTIYTRTAKFVKKAETEVTTSGSTYTFTVKNTNSSGNNNEGYLDNVYRDVPNMTFSIGGENQIPMVANNGSTYDLYVERSSGMTSASRSGNLPTGGTFYKFEPETDGKFSLSGYFKNCGSNNIAEMFVTENGNVVKLNKFIAKTADNTFVTLSEIDVQAGKTYYFYVYTDDYTHHFALKSFSYTPTYFFTNKSYTITKGSSTSFTQTQTLQGVSGATVEYSCIVAKDSESELTASVDSNTGTVTISSPTDKDGGAVIVTATVNSTTKVSYVITVPYIGEHTWDFHNIANKEEEKTTGTWKLAYEVDKVETGEVKDPIVVIENAIEGDNAKYISESNGITISAKKDNLGLQVTGYRAGSDIGSSDVTKKHNASINDVTLVRHLAFSSAYQKTTITLPQLKKDYYVRVYWKPHAGGQSGSAMKVTNLCDLTGAEVVNTFNVLGTQFKDYDVNKDYDGGTSFIVKEDGDVTMTLQDGSWNKIVKIEVMKDFRTDMTAKNKYRNKTNGTLYLDWDETTDKPTNPVTIETNGLDYYRSGGTYTLWLTGAPGQVLAENGAWVTYTTEAYGGDGFVIGDGVQQKTYGWYSDGHGYYNDLVVTVSKGVGNLKVVRDIIYNGYILDRDENWYAVGYLDKQPYPYTWDFTEYNMYKGTTITGSFNDNATTLINVQAPNYGAWVKGLNATQGWLENKACTVKSTLALYNDNTNKTTENLRDVEKPLHANGSQPYFGTTPVVETKGLGISCSGNFGLAGTHVRSDKEYNIKIPTVDAGMYVFIKAGAKPTNVTNATVYNGFDKWKKDDVYCYKVTETGDVDITLNKALVYKIGVTDQIKDITYYGWTTESRAIAIDHNETGSFSAATKAYKVVNTAGWDKTYDVKVKDGNIVELPAGAYIPAGNGVLLQNTECTWTKANGILNKPENKVTVPLFVPAVNIPAATADLSGNLLVASTTETTPSTSITGTKVTDHEQYYTLSNYYYKVHEDNSKKEDVQFVSDPAFYRYIGSGTTLVNKAYLKMTLPTSGSTAKSDNKGFEDSDETTGISEFIIDNEAVEKGNDTYYNVSGQALNSIPVQRGIYIKNGKKIYVK